MIMPLASRRDRITQVRWGIGDFRARFGRDPEGMWLPETAVDTETLEVLAEAGIRFTILAPHQAARIRPLTGGDWREVGEAIDPSRAYRWTGPSGHTLALFFYDAPVSRAIAFEGILQSGEALATRLLGAFHGEREWPQLVHCATDGESYGHHSRFGEMALAAALEQIEATGAAVLTNYAAFLAMSPPDHEVEIRENTSWSCAHGVERWRERLRLPHGPRHAAGLAGTAARRPRLAGRRGRRLLRGARLRTPQGSVGGARRLHRRDRGAGAGRLSNGSSPRRPPPPSTETRGWRRDGCSKWSASDS